MLEVLEPEKANMKDWISRYFSIFKKRRILPPASLKFQLTLGITVFSIMSLVGVTAWTSLRMQRLLVNSHKYKIEEIAEKFSQEVAIYSEMEMISRDQAIEKVIAKPEIKGHLVWIRDDQGNIITESMGFQDDLDLETHNQLLEYTNMPLKPKVALIGGRYWVACAGPIQLSEENLGKLYLVTDITREYTIFLSIVYSLIPATILSTILLILISAWYIRKSLEPLQQMSLLTETISADDLSDYRLKLEQAPSEVSMLANTCNKMLDRLSESWEQQREFVGNVSHELRTPLTIVQGYIQSTLRRGDNLTPPQREGLEVAANEAERTIRLLQDLLELARADHGNLHLQVEVFNVNTLVSEVWEMAQQFSQGRVHLEPIPRNFKVKADRNRLKQVLLNLIDNALKYSEPEQPITLKVKQKEKRVYISVCDRGQGIPLQHQSRIFDRFYRVDEARTRAGGTGLGLSIVKTLVEGMGGRVTLLSKPGKGSIFTVILPGR
ncbi:MAG: HAMP domain-containing sensor histidine kinase [Cyanobacteriota bacterium]|nr:HAMP domain-containing sensor histidine kinase [Cyanobacteriota bacterium]